MNKPIEPFISSTSIGNTNLQKGMDFDVRPKSPEEKLFIILYVLNEDEEDELRNHCFSLCIGRTEAYNDIKNKLISGLDIDIHLSKIITETKQTETESGDRKYYLLPYEECISIYSFFISTSEYYSEDDFDIEEYNNTSVPDQNELEKNPNYINKEELDYLKMIESSMSIDNFLNSIGNTDENGNLNI